MIEINNYIAKNELHSVMSQFFFAAGITVAFAVFVFGIITFQLIPIILGLGFFYVCFQCFYGSRKQPNYSLLMDELYVRLPEKIEIDKTEIVAFLLGYQNHIRTKIKQFQTNIVIIDKEQIAKSFDEKTQIPESLQEEFQSSMETIMYRLLYLKNLIKERSYDK